MAFRAGRILRGQAHYRFSICNNLLNVNFVINLFILNYITKTTEQLISVARQIIFEVLLKLIVFHNILRKLYEPLPYPHRLDYLEIGAQGDKHAQKLVDVVKLAYVLVPALA